MGLVPLFRMDLLVPVVAQRKLFQIDVDELRATLNRSTAKKAVRLAPGSK